MTDFKKAYLKIISFLVAVIFLLNSTAYGIALPRRTHLRKSLDFGKNTVSEIQRYRSAYDKKQDRHITKYRDDDEDYDDDLLEELTSEPSYTEEPTIVKTDEGIIISEDIQIRLIMQPDQVFSVASEVLLVNGKIISFKENPAKKKGFQINDISRKNLEVFSPEKEEWITLEMLEQKLDEEDRKEVAEILEDDAEDTVDESRIEEMPPLIEVYALPLEKTDVVSDGPRVDKEEVFRQRASSYLKSCFTLQYGNLDKNDTVNRYLRDLSEDALGGTSSEFHAIVLPGWDDINAVALPDGTILVSARAVTFCGYREELKALLFGHEATHIKREHTRKYKEILREKNRQNKTWRDLIGNVLSDLGVKRYQELEADIRWMFEEKGLNINPLAQVVLLERMGHWKNNFKRDSSIDFVHGESFERALDTESVFFFFDHKALTSDLGERIALDIKRSLLGRQYAFLDEDLHAQRLEIAKTIPIEQIGIAIEGVAKLFKNSDQKSKHQKVLELLAERVDKEIFPKEDWPDEWNRRLAIALFYEFHSGLHYLFSEEDTVCEVLKDRHFNKRRNVWTFNDLARIQAVLESESFAKLSLLPIAVSPNSISRNIAEFALDRLNLKEAPTEESVLAYIKFASWWQDVMKQLYEERGIDVEDSEGVFDIIMEPLYSNIENQDKRLYRFAMENAQHTRDVSTEDGTIDNIATLISERIKSEKSPGISHYQDISKSIEKHLVGKSASEVYDFFRRLRLTLFDRNAKLAIKASIKTSEGEYKTRQEVFTLQDRREAYIVFSLFEEAITTWDSLRDLAESIKDIWLISGIIDIIYALEVDEAHGLNIRFNLDDKGRLVLTQVDYKGNPIDYFNVEHFYFYKGGGSFNVPLWSDSSGIPRIRNKLALVEEKVILPERDDKEIAELYSILYEREPIFLDKEKTITKELFCMVLARHLAQSASWQEFCDKAEEFESFGVPVFNIMEQWGSHFGVVFAKLWPYLPEHPSNLEIQQIRRFADVINDPFLRMRFSSYYYQQVWPIMTYNEKLDILFDKSNRSLFDMQWFNTLIDQEATTRGELHEAKERLQNAIDVFTATQSRFIGGASILSYVLYGSEYYMSVLDALLDTWKSDRALKNELYALVDEDMGGLSRMGMGEKVAVVDAIEAKLFRMDSSAKYFLLKKLLTGPKGLISQREKRIEFLNSMMSRLIKSEDGKSGIMATISEVTNGIGSIKSWKPLYFPLQPLLATHIAIPPQDISTWRDILEIRYIQNIGDADFEEELDKMNPVGELTLSQLETRCNSHVYKMYPWRYEKEWLAYSEELLIVELTQRGVEIAERNGQTFSPLEFVVEIAQNFGSIGVRFLQLLPQFVDLSEEEQSAFSKVYDAVYGQNKFSAVFSILEREWPDIWDNITHIEEREGGGSMMTVFGAETIDGKEDVIKVLNPNLEYLLDYFGSYLDELLEQLSNDYGDKYETANLIMEEVREWIKRDVNFKNFAEKDPEFRGQNHGFTSDGFSYEMYVPLSKGPRSKYFIREEKIEGDNLTQWEKLKQDGHDMKEIISLVVKNYVGQLKRGLVHSDVHVGNFRVTSDRKIAILDRNFYLELSPEIQEVINLFLNPLALTMSSSSQVIDKILKASEISGTIRRKQLETSWDTAKTGVLSGNWKSLTHFFVELRRDGVKPPLEITLICKNLNALQQMSNQAGFDNLIQAYLYSGSNLLSDSPSQGLSRDLKDTKVRRQGVFTSL